MSYRRYFVDMRALKEHFKTKVHKKRYGHDPLNTKTEGNILTLSFSGENLNAPLSLSTQVEAAQRGALHSGWGRESRRHGLLHRSKGCPSDDAASGGGHGMQDTHLKSRTEWLLNMGVTKIITHASVINVTIPDFLIATKMVVFQPDVPTTRLDSVRTCVIT